MVTFPAALRALDRKLLRDLWAMKGQGLAIASVIAAGVAMYVAYFSNFDSLQRARADYYDGARFADVFASLTRAPQSLAPRIAAIPGVERIATRVVADVTLDVEGLADPATARLISLPENGRPPLNDLVLRRGRWIDTSADNEVIASERFVNAHGFNPGDSVIALINGRRRSLTIVGVALSPEYIYAIRPGEIVPDAKRFGVFWMDERSLAAAFDMDGAFNDVALDLAAGGSAADVMSELDRLLAPYGGRGAMPRSLQLSAWSVENELSQLQTFGMIVPLIFMSVAAFILNVAMTRALTLQRVQIAALKALGYSNRSLAWHYTKWAAVIGAAGALTGIAAGAWLGAKFTGLYNYYFNFPALTYHLSATLVMQALAGSLVIAALGAQSAVRRAVRVPPAVAMRPEGPARYSRSLIEVRWHPLRLTFTGRMVARNMQRQPARTAMSVLGIALGVSVLFVGLSFLDVMDRLIDAQFTDSMRQDATIALNQPRTTRALFSIAHLPGVIDVEPMRAIPVRLRSRAQSRTLAIVGLPASPQLDRVVDRVHGPITLPAEGLVLSSTLGRLLGIQAGDTVQVELLEGRRDIETIAVAGFVDDELGLRAYMRIDRAQRLLHEGGTITGAAVTIDPAARDDFYDAIKNTPAIASVSLRDAMLANFEVLVAENMNLQIFINVMFAGIIAFGVIYNAARVSLSERSRELASLRVLGFTRAEISLILLGELAALTVLALPLGAAIGYGMGHAIMASMNNEMYRMTFIVTPATIAWSWLTTIAAAGMSALLVRQRLDHLDLIGVLKTSE